jgi:hypothetical protein
VPENARDFFQGERALSTHIIESRPAGYSKEQIVDPRRWSALPVLLAGAFLPILDFNVVNLCPAGHAGRSRRKFERSAVRHLGLCRDLCGVSDHRRPARRPLRTAADVSLVRNRIHNRLSAAWCRMVTWHPGRRANPSIQGFAATMLTPQVLASIRALFPPDEQGRALGSYGVIGSAVTLTVAT